MFVERAKKKKQQKGKIPHVIRLSLPFLFFLYLSLGPHKYVVNNYGHEFVLELKVMSLSDAPLRLERLSTRSSYDNCAIAEQIFKSRRHRLFILILPSLISRASRLTRPRDACTWGIDDTKFFCIS